MSWNPPPFKFKPTETLTINKDNWSGEDVTLKIDRANLAWEQYGDTFWLVFHPWPEEDHDVLGPGRYKIHGESWSADYVLGVVELPSPFDIKRSESLNSKPWAMAKGDPGVETSIERESNVDPTVDRVLASIEAAAKLLFNTV